MNPTLYEIDTRAWLDALGHRYMTRSPLSLDRVPGAELDRLRDLGFDWVWLLGAWQTGRIGREVSLSRPDWVRGYQEVLPDFRPEDVVGSVFAVQAYEVAPALGGDAALRRLRGRLRERGVRLMLDFVPNHTARDHPWVSARPEFYVHGTEADLAREPQNYARAETVGGPAVLAFGRDPYFPGWPDTFQLNYRHRGLRDAMAGELTRVAGLCDGLRCDMAMLLLPDVFLSTWGDRARPADGSEPDDSPFWPAAIARARARHPEMFLLAEAYWDLEWSLQQQGFDATYDKRLYDRLRARDAASVRGHLHADPEYQRRSARFLENHDEERAAVAFPPDVHRAAAVVTFLVPGLRFFHQGQLEGRKVHPSVHLARRPDDPTDPALAAFYDRLLSVLKRPEPRLGRWRLAECREAWPGNPTWDHFLAFGWDGPTTGRLLAAVNYGPTPGQCFVTLPPEAPSVTALRFRDLLGPAVYDRDARDLSARGLYLDLPAWGFHVFAVEPC
jgi:glycosidase